MIRANPANNETLKRPPVRIVLNFSEPVERKLTEIQVEDKDGARFDDGPTAFDDKDPTFASVGVKTLEPGLYFVKWSNVSTVDGHNLRGSYPFIVLNPDGTFPAGASFDDARAETGEGDLLPSNVDIALKWLALLALASVAGAAFFLLAVLRPAGKFLEDEPYHEAMDAGERWLVNLVHVLLPLSFIAAAFLVLRTVNRFETDTGLWSYLTTIRTGQYRGIQLILIAVALAGGDLLFLGGSERKPQHRARRAPRRQRRRAVHLLDGEPRGDRATAGSGRPRPTSFTSSRSSTWLGALVMLPPLLHRHRRSTGADDEGERFLYLANAFDRFSIVAGISVIAVLATWHVQWARARSRPPTRWSHTTYGKVLLAKIILLCPCSPSPGSTPSFSSRDSSPSSTASTSRAAPAPRQSATAWSRRLASLQRALPITIVVEIALVVAVFAAVGVLSQTATAKGEVAQTKALTAAGSKFNQSATQGDLKLTLEVSPNRVGPQRLRPHHPDGRRQARRDRHVRSAPLHLR